MLRNQSTSEVPEFNFFDTANSLSMAIFVLFEKNYRKFSINSQNLLIVMMLPKSLENCTSTGEYSKLHHELLKSGSIVSFRCFITDIRSLRLNSKVVLFQVSLAS